MDGDTRALPDRAAEGGATGMLLSLPEPAPSATRVAEPSVASESLPGILDRTTTTVTGLDERVGQVETDVQHRHPARQLAWPLIADQTWLLVLALATVATVLFLRLLALDRLQAEIYGDIAIVYEYIIDIQAGNWPTHFSLSAGPLYHYIIMPIIV